MSEETFLQRSLLLLCNVILLYMLFKFLNWFLKVITKSVFHYPTLFAKLHDPNWEEDVVYLHQFKRSPVVPNLSPFCLKVESWLRAHDIKYKVCESMMFRSKEGLLPFVEINGKQIADSQLILTYLQDHFKIRDALTADEKGTARAVDRMIEGNTFYCLLYSKAYENARKLVDASVSGISLPSLLVKLIAYFATYIIGKKLDANGMSRHDRSDIVAILRNDISAVDSILGDKKFLFGDLATTSDFTVFGHLATTYYLPYVQPIQTILDREFPRVKNYLDRMRVLFFPEWGHPSAHTSRQETPLE